LVCRLTCDHITGEDISAGQDDGADHGHQQEDGSELEGKQVIRKEMLTNPERGFFANGGWAGKGPSGGEGHPEQKDEKTDANPS
jgi:hypothetical protein